MPASAVVAGGVCPVRGRRPRARLSGFPSGRARAQPHHPNSPSGVWRRETPFDGEWNGMDELVPSVFIFLRSGGKDESFASRRRKEAINRRRVTPLGLPLSPQLG